MTEQGSSQRVDKRRATLALAPGLIAFSMGQSVLFAVAGPVIREIGLTEFQLGMIVSAAAVVFVISSPIWGRLSDRWGRKTVILTGLFTYSVISLAFAGVMDVGLRGWMGAGAVFVTLLSLRVLYAALGTGIQPSSVALMADLSSDDDRSSAVAIVGAAFGFGMILGPAAAALLVGFGVLTPLYAIAGLGFVCLVIALVFLDAPPAKAADKGPKEPLDYGRLVPIMAITLLLFAATSGLQQTIAFYVQDYLGADAMEAARMTGICFVAMAAASLVSQGILIQLLKPGPGALLKIGLPIMAAGMVLYALPANFWQIVIACAVIGLGFGFANPGVISAASLRTGSKSQGAAAGIIQALMAAGYIFGPLVGTGSYQANPMLAAGFITVCIGLSALIALTLRLGPAKRTE
ncbi:MAG: MFS transporter, partial [Pseudomonadota bacterium]